MKEILYDWGGANVRVFHWINDLRGEVIDRIMLLGTQLGSHTNFEIYLALLAVVAVLSVSRNPAQNRSGERALAWLMVISVLSIAYLLDEALLSWLKPALDFSRPPFALPQGTVHIVGRPEYHYSLPSGHASFAMLMAASLWPVLNGYSRIGAIILVLWVGLSRVSLGAHFPADVLAGYLSSLMVVLLVRGALHSLLRYRAKLGTL